MIPVPTFILGIAVEGIIRHQTFLQLQKLRGWRWWLPDPLAQAQCDHAEYANDDDMLLEWHRSLTLRLLPTPAQGLNPWGE